MLKNEIIITPLQIYEVPVLIKRHGEGTIYKISDIHCVKVPSGDNYSIEKMGYEIKTYLITVLKILTKRYCLLRVFLKKHKVSITLRRASWGEEILTKPGQNWPGLAIHQPSTCVF